VLWLREGDEARRGVRIVVAARAVIAFDAREIALELRAAEELVVVNDAAEEAEELGARHRGELLGDVGLIELFRAVYGHRSMAARP